MLMHAAHAHLQQNKHVYESVCVFVFVYVCARVRACVGVRAGVGLCVCVCLCVCGMCGRTCVRCVYTYKRFVRSLCFGICARDRVSVCARAYVSRTCTFRGHPREKRLSPWKCH